MLTCLSLLLSSRALLEGKSVGNLIRGTWASIYEVYVAVVTATTLLLKLDAQVHNWVSKGTSLGGQAHPSSWLFSLLRCKMSLILPKHLYSVTSPPYYKWLPSVIFSFIWQPSISCIRICILDLQPTGRSSSLYPDEVKSSSLYVYPWACLHVPLAPGYSCDSWTPKLS